MNYKKILKEYILDNEYIFVFNENNKFYFSSFENGTFIKSENISDATVILKSQLNEFEKIIKNKIKKLKEFQCLPYKLIIDIDKDLSNMNENQQDKIKKILENLENPNLNENIKKKKTFDLNNLNLILKNKDI